MAAFIYVLDVGHVICVLVIFTNYVSQCVSFCSMAVFMVNGVVGGLYVLVDLSEILLKAGIRLGSVQMSGIEYGGKRVKFDGKGV